MAPAPGQHQTNFAKMIWKFNNVYNADRQYSEHLSEARYLLPPPAERRRGAAGPQRAVRPCPDAPKSRTLTDA